MVILIHKKTKTQFSRGITFNDTSIPFEGNNVINTYQFGKRVEAQAWKINNEGTNGDCHDRSIPLARGWTVARTSFSFLRCRVG